MKLGQENSEFFRSRSQSKCEFCYTSRKPFLLAAVASVGVRASFCQQKIVFLETASKESRSALHRAKPLTVNELCLAARKAIGNGKYQYKKKQEKKG